MLVNLVQPLINILNGIIDSISSLFEYLSLAFEDLYSLPAVFPSLWSCVPSSVTNIFFGLLIVISFIGILKFFLTK